MKREPAFTLAKNNVVIGAYCLTVIRSRVVETYRRKSFSLYGEINRGVSYSKTEVLLRKSRKVSSALVWFLTCKSR